MKRINKLFLVLAVVFAGSVSVQAQSNPTYTAISVSLQGTGSVVSSTTVTFPAVGKTLLQPNLLRERNKMARLRMKLDLGNDYVKNGIGWNFKVQVDLSYQLGSNPSVNRTLIITQAKPELLKVEDLLANFNSTISVSPLSISINSVGITDGANNPISNTLLQNYINANIRLVSTLEREYETDVRLQSGLMSAAPVIYPVSISGRLVTFSWQPSSIDAYPNYEIQLLKLYNSAVSQQTNQNQIAADIDWSRVLSVETQSYKNNVKLTVAEGTGYYLWRIRPVGNYFKDGVANSENYGAWSYALPTSTATSVFNKNVLLANPGANPYAFYFTDPDEDINWIYSRVFTEGDNINKSNPSGTKTSEGITYANGLLMSRQTQKYNSSENTNIVSQTGIDYSGRPAIMTIPIPVQGNLTGYKTVFTKNSSGGLYTAADFDTDSKLYSPETIKDNGSNNPFSYYSNNSTLSNGIDNTNVANAEGYAYKRTVFKNDGTNRVSEESGVGKAHSLGQQSNGQGRTTRVFYGTPSDDELIRIFGDEAPLANSVIKTVTIDQNNVVSVTYTSKEGKTIATALMSDNANNLKQLKKAATTLTVSNAIKENVSSNGKIVASKRIVIPANNWPVKLTYSNESLPANSGGCPSGDCNFKMRLYLTDLNTGVVYVSDAVSSSTVINDFTPSSSFAFPSGWAFVSTGAGTPTLITPTGAGNNEVTLNSGEYFLVKEIYSGNSESYVDDLVNAENDKTKPVIDALIAQMQTVNSAASYSTFAAMTNSLITLMGAYNTASVYTQSASLPMFNLLQMDVSKLPSGYYFPPSSEFSIAPITQNTVDASYNNFEIVTGCCGSIKTAIPGPPVCYLCDGSPSTVYTSTTIAAMTAANDNTVNPVTPYGINDFKADGSWSGLSTASKLSAINSMVEREFIKPLKDKMTEEGYDINNDLWKIAPGFTYGSLNYMLSNMLVSQYYTGAVVQNTVDGKWYAASYDASTNGYTLSVPVNSLTNIAYNYDCKKLLDAWRSSIELINGFEVGADDNILASFNDQGTYGNGQDNSEDDGNWLLNNALAKKYLKKKISKELEDFNDSQDGKVSSARKESATSVINTFMKDAGYQFAAIVDGASLPSYLSASATPYPDDYVSYSVTATAPGSILTTIYTGTTANNAVPLLFQSNGTLTPTTFTWNCSTLSGTVTAGELYYPYIVKPEWQFKYFVYNVYENKLTTSPAINFIDDNDVMLPNQVTVDIQRKYNLPFSYLPSAISSTLTPGDLCVTPAAINYTVGASTGTFNYLHNNWSSYDRLSFYESVKGAPKCYSSKGIPSGDDLYESGQLPTCSTKDELYDMAIADLNQRIKDCYTKKGAIKSALINELGAACYTIVPCKTGTGAGQVTDKEIDLMVAAVIAQATAQVQYVKTALITGVTDTTATTACTSASSFTFSYGNTLCSLPCCAQVECKEIVLYNTNDLTVKTSRKIIPQLYRECDQKILDMIANGTFLPDIAPFGECTKPAKVWKNSSCSPEQSCGAEYSEKTTCPPSGFKTYSKTFTVTATGN